MIITKRLKQKIVLAQHKGYKCLVVTKAGKYCNTAIQSHQFSDILKQENGNSYYSGGLGTWISKKHPYPVDGIGYHNIFVLKEEVFFEEPN